MSDTGDSQSELDSMEDCYAILKVVFRSKKYKFDVSAAKQEFFAQLAVLARAFKWLERLL